MRTLFEWLKLLSVILLIITVGELPAVKALAAIMDEHRRLLLQLTIGFTVAGALALIWGFIGAGRDDGRPMTHEEFEQLAARTQILGPSKRFSKARFRGKFTGVVVPETSWTFQEMKAAWRIGAWWIDTDMRRKFVITAGGALFVLSAFALFMVLVQPPSIKLLLGGAVLYAITRLMWSFSRA